MERAVLAGIDFNLYVEKETYVRWVGLLEGLIITKERDIRQWRKLVQKSRQTAPLTVPSKGTWSARTRSSSPAHLPRDSGSPHLLYYKRRGLRQRSVLIGGIIIPEIFPDLSGSFPDYSFSYVFWNFLPFSRTFVFFVVVYKGCDFLLSSTKLCFAFSIQVSRLYYYPMMFSYRYVINHKSVT
ncbi:hypothetical protein BGY98DRAFT_687278 [Russula aff. rugulosa BPL654]|nr:hypothetical protein BGY98DRAFT_687278 [Russula aff. rugulosa BPL654]